MQSEFILNGSPVRTMTFPGGEVGVNVQCYGRHIKPTLKLVAKLRDANGIMVLLNIMDAIKRQHDNATIHLHIPYVPYARQDRVCNPGESLSIKVFANLILPLPYDTLTIVDPHSLVTPAVLDDGRLRVISQEEIVLNHCIDIREAVYDGKALLVAPDADSTKKMEGLVSELPFKDASYMHFVQGVKKRNLATGALSGFDYDKHYSVRGHDCIIVDDICDGGSSFIGLAQKLLNGGARSVGLFVTHGIFSKGLHVFNDVITKIWTTNTLPQLDPQVGKKINDLPGYTGKFTVYNYDLPGV